MPPSDRLIESTIRSISRLPTIAYDAALNFGLNRVTRPD
jgi:hypothetical protein